MLIYAIVDSDKSGESHKITVITAEDILEPFTIGSVTYKGKADGGSGSPQITSDSKFEITEPTVAEFDADGFFTMIGSNGYTDDTNPSISVSVVKDATDDRDDYKILSGDFSKRYWFPFESGSYTVSVNGQSGLLYKFIVNNTSQTIGRFLFPMNSFPADHIEIHNQALAHTYYTDDIDSPLFLQYLVYYSKSNNIDTVANCEANGTAFDSYRQNIDSKSVSGFEPGTTYYLTVLVKDTSGNKAIYNTAMQATEASSGSSDYTAPVPSANKIQRNTICNQLCTCIEQPPLKII